MNIAMMKRALAAGLCVALLAECKSGTLVGSQQTCESSGGLFSEGRVSCTGSVDAVRGEPRLGIIDADEELSGEYRLRATIEVGEGTAKARVTTASGDQVGGEVSPGNPLQIDAVVELSETDEEFAVDLKVAGKKVTNLSYKAALVPQG